MIALTMAECEALLARVEGSQTQRRLPGYRALLESARAKLAAHVAGGGK